MRNKRLKLSLQRFLPTSARSCSMPESAGLHSRRLLPGGQVPALLFKHYFIPVAELSIPSGSCLRSAAPFSARNCLLSAGVCSAQLPSAPDSLPASIREGNNPFAHLCCNRLRWDGAKTFHSFLPPWVVPSFLMVTVYL